MGHDDDRLEPEEISVFYPDSIELIDPLHDALKRHSATLPTLPPQPQLRSRKRVTLLLFAATCLSTFLVGMTPGAGPAFLEILLRGKLFEIPFATLQAALIDGAAFSSSVMLILLAHEMGHYLQARRYHVPASLPYFIPMPISPFGTMGAVIVQGAGVANRKQLYDIAITGPLAGLVFALPIAFFGIMNSQVAVIPPNVQGPIYGNPLLFTWMIEAVHGPMAANQDIMLTPLVFAGWVGIFITALNLIPIGQLDGGHILYTLIGKRAHVVATLLLLGAVAYMVYSSYFAYGLMVILLLLMGPRHPPTVDDRIPLGWPRVILGWLTLAFIIIGFTPTPIV